MTYIVPAPCELLLKAAGVNQNSPRAYYHLSPAIISRSYYTLLEIKLFMWGEIYLNQKQTVVGFFPTFVCLLWAPLCWLYFRMNESDRCLSLHWLLSSRLFFRLSVPPDTYLQVKLKFDSSCEYIFVRGNKNYIDTVAIVHVILHVFEHICGDSV